MKTSSLSLWAVVGGVIFCTLAPISGQNAPVDLPSLQIEALIGALTAQNKQLAANQAAMDARIDEIAESIRQARIMTARAAGRGAK